MNIIRNGLAAIGAISIVLVLYAIYIIEPVYHRFNSFDDKALATYQSFFMNILKTGNMAEANVWKIPVDKNISASKVDEVMKHVANVHDFKTVGEFSLSENVVTENDKAFRLVKTYMFSNALTSAKMVRYSDSFSAYLPSQITLVEDKESKLWLYSLNIDSIIYGGTSLPKELKEEVLNLKKIIVEIMKRGASGEL